MRKVAPVCVGLGVFLLVAGLVAVLWAPGVVKKTPLDVDSTTRLEGQASRIDAETGGLGEAVDVAATSITRSDSEASTDDVVVFTSSQCLVVAEGSDAPDCVDGTDERLITAGTDVFAADRVTALSLEEFEGLPDSAVPHAGVVNKWPFGAEQRTYPYWDGVVGEAVDADFDRTEEVDGIEVNVYVVEISDASVEVAEGVEGTYDDRKEIWVDPVTGAIVNQVDDQQRFLADGTPALDLQLAFTADQVAANVADAQSNISSMRLITLWITVIGVVGGPVLLLAGAASLLRARKHEHDEQSHERRHAELV